MPEYTLYGVPDDQWLSAAFQSRTMKAAVELVGVARYVAWMNLAKKHRMDLVEAMRAELTVNRERAHLPRCNHDGCDRPVKVRRMCKRHYEAWLANTDADQKIRRAVYPADEQIIEWFKTDYSQSAVARRIGVARETLRDYLTTRPELFAKVQPFFRLPAEVVRQREAEARRRWRGNNPDVVREINRRWGRNQAPSKRRRWNTCNRQRRLEQVIPLTSEEAADAAAYAGVVRQDPCVYCGGPAGTVDHIRPINSAGVDLWENLAGACQPCNAQKNDKELLHYLLWRLEHGAPPRGGVANPIGPVGR